MEIYRVLFLGELVNVSDLVVELRRQVVGLDVPLVLWVRLHGAVHVARRPLPGVPAGMRW